MGGNLQGPRWEQLGNNYRTGLGLDPVLTEMSTSPFTAFIFCWIKPLKILNFKLERSESLNYTSRDVWKSVCLGQQAVLIIQADEGKSCCKWQITHQQIINNCANTSAAAAQKNNLLIAVVCHIRNP